MEIIPSTAATWLEEAKKANVQKTSIHSLDDLNSGSKLNEKQFLALRAIWKQEKRNKFSPDSWGLPIPEARELLAKNKDWKSFLSHVTSRTPTSYTVPKVGTFSSSWDLLQQIRDYPRTAPSATKVLFSPAGPKTRSRQEQKAPRRDPYTTPSRPQTTIDEAMGDIAIDMPSWEESSDLMGSFMLESEANSPVTKEEAKTLFPPLDDEPTVNACLIVFLNAVCFHHRGLGMHWSMQQKAFNFGSGGSVFEARVDGYLRAKSDRSKRSKVIAEVKPYARADRKDVRFQETAQMAAWIFAEPDKTSKSGKYALVPLAAGFPILPSLEYII